MIEHKIVRMWPGYEAESIFDSWKDEEEQAKCSCGKHSTLRGIEMHIKHFTAMELK